MAKVAKFCQIWSYSSSRMSPTYRYMRDLISLIVQKINFLMVKIIFQWQSSSRSSNSDTCCHQVINAMILFRHCRLLPHFQHCKFNSIHIWRCPRCKLLYCSFICKSFLDIWWHLLVEFQLGLHSQELCASNILKY